MLDGPEAWRTSLREGAASGLEVEIRKYAQQRDLSNSASYFLLSSLVWGSFFRHCPHGNLALLSLRPYSSSTGITKTKVKGASLPAWARPMPGKASYCPGCCHVPVLVRHGNGRDSMKNCFFFLAPFPASFLARTGTPTLHMTYSRVNVGPPYKGQGINDFGWGGGLFQHNR